MQSSCRWGGEGRTGSDSQGWRGEERQNCKVVPIEEVLYCLLRLAPPPHHLFHLASTAPLLLFSPSPFSSSSCKTCPVVLWISNLPHLGKGLAFSGLVLLLSGGLIAFIGVILFNDLSHAISAPAPAAYWYNALRMSLMILHTSVCAQPSLKKQWSLSLPICTVHHQDLNMDM